MVQSLTHVEGDGEGEKDGGRGRMREKKRKREREKGREVVKSYGNNSFYSRKNLYQPYFIRIS